jgi:hypothetical protein
MLAVLWDLGLEKYIVKNVKALDSADKLKPTNEGAKVQKKWKEGDTKAHMPIELSIGNDPHQQHRNC